MGWFTKVFKSFGIIEKDPWIRCLEALILNGVVDSSDPNSSNSSISLKTEEIDEQLFPGMSVLKLVFRDCSNATGNSIIGESMCLVTKNKFFVIILKDMSKGFAFELDVAVLNMDKILQEAELVWRSEDKTTKHFLIQESNSFWCKMVLEFALKKESTLTYPIQQVITFINEIRSKGTYLSAKSFSYE